MPEKIRSDGTVIPGISFAVPNWSKKLKETSYHSCEEEKSQGRGEWYHQEVE
jgi:hypothetical protein